MTLLQSFTRADFAEAERERLPANLGKFCFLLVDRCRTSLFPNGARPVFRFLVRLLEKLEGDIVVSMPTGLTRGASVSLDNSGRTGSMSATRTLAATKDSELTPIFKALNRIIILLLANTAYGAESDLVLTFNNIIHNQKIVFSPYNHDNEFMYCLCFHLYKYLLADSKVLRETSLTVSYKWLFVL